ncbi:DDB1- and CUL4-associated factor 11 [Anthonomus grandis grandis]|uniref:DDB1- and CUL4-associated factor 11 n=1 Tax=Anthonomus grandis grandis TaxID=2921223 RepID=UPI0021652E8E|nr:DDB1- and CUL4-associated factor 11 [Anthonomus grandis grandis]
MGALNSRSIIMTVDDDDDSSRIEDTSEDTDTMDSDSDSGEHFVTMLHNLISSGQLLLQGADDVDNSPFNSIRQKKPPTIKIKPDTTVLDKSNFSVITKQGCGLVDPLHKNMKTHNVAALLKTRQSGLYKHDNFSKTFRCKLANQYIPNEMTSLNVMGSGKMFCGIFSESGDTFVTASQDRMIGLYDSSTGFYKMQKRIKARDVGWSIIDVALSPKGDQFVYSTWSSSVHMCPVHSYSDHQEPLTIATSSRRFCIFSVVYSSDGTELLCGANDGCFYIYDINRKERTLKIPAHKYDANRVEYDVNRVLFADNSSHIIFSGADDGLVKVWDRRILNDNDRSSKPVGLLAGHLDGITYIDSRGDGLHLISNSKDQSIKLWDLRSFSNESVVQESLKAVKKQSWDYRWQMVPKGLYQYHKMQGDTSIMTYRGHMVSKTLIRARFSPAATTGQRYIYTGCGLGRVVIYDSLTGKIVMQKKGHMTCVRDVSWHPSRNEILSSSWDSLVGKWTFSTPDPWQTEKENPQAEALKPVRRSARIAAQRRRTGGRSNE